MIINPIQAIKKRWIYPVTQEQIQANSVDLTLNTVYQVDYNDRPRYDNEWGHVATAEIPSPSDFFYLDKGNVYQFWFNEEVKLPKNVTAFVCHRSSFNRYGVLIVSSIYDAGFYDTIGATCYPHIDCAIKKNSRVAQIFFVYSKGGKIYNGLYNQFFKSLVKT